TYKSRHCEAPPVSYYTDRSLLSGGHHLRTALSPTTNNFFVWMPKNRRPADRDHCNAGAGRINKRLNLKWSTSVVCYFDDISAKISVAPQQRILRFFFNVSCEN